ncbi:MAG TPA: carboxypeptidase-like regulatory domain-containing protein [Terriglobia bacterium]|nr:carboxypeptidase-like regulatory domain-containing protein [Terriglobia bacterium]
MRHLIALLILMPLAVQTPPPRPPPPPPPVRVSGPIPQTGEGQIDGLIRRFSDQEPITGARVTLTGPPDRTGAVGQLTTTTGNDGRFSFPNLLAGRYIVDVRHEGYFVRRPHSGTPDPAQVLVGPGKSSTQVALLLIQGGTISGRILDPMGRPSPLTSVTAAKQIYRDGRPVLTPVKTTTSDDRGEYRLWWLEPGEYVISAEKNLPAGRARGYFPGSDDGRAAIPIRVGEGTDASRTDFSLAAFQATVTVSGAVNYASPVADSASPTARPGAAVSSDQKTISDATRYMAPQFFLVPLDSPRLYEAMSEVPNAVLNSRDRADGKFELRNVRSGSYELFAVSQDQSSKSYMAHQTIDVGNQDLGNIALTARPNIDLRGTVTAGVGKPAPSVRIHFRPRLPLPNWPGLTLVSTDGKFVIPNVPESHYLITVEPLEPNSYVAEFLHGNDSILGQGAVTVAAGLADTLDVLIQPAAATIRGVVVGLTSRLNDGVIITLVPGDDRRANLSLYKRLVSTDGSFSFVGIGPGNYKVLAWESLPDGAEMNAEFMEAFNERGSDVVASAGSTSSVQVRLISK